MRDRLFFDHQARPRTSRGLLLAVLMAMTAAATLFLSLSTAASAEHGSGSVVQQHWELLSETHLGLLAATTIPVHRGVIPGGTSKFNPEPTATFVIVARASAGLGDWEVELRATGCGVLAEILLSETATISEYQMFAASFAWPSWDCKKCWKTRLLPLS